MKTPLFLLSVLLLTLTARSQHVQTKRLSIAERQRLFMTSAAALPRLYEKKDFDSISLFVQQRWDQGPTDPDLLCQAILLSIQRHIFYLTDFSNFNNLTWPLINECQAYADALAGALGPTPSDYNARAGYNVAAIDKQLFATTSRWAYDLLRDEDLDSVETFLCRVFDGEIANPGEYLAKLRPGFGAADALFEHRLAQPRKLGALFSFSAGSWLPMGKLSQLGVHPSLGYEFGARNWLNEWDLDAAIRFVRTPNPYTILRNDTLMSRNFFEGGNLSLTYIRYLVHSARHEFGVSAGVGADFIDFADDAKDVDWSPTEIVSFDVNLGLRYNYHIGKHGFLGFAARYHFLNFCNPGGSSFEGNAFTLDVIFGGVMAYRH